MCIIFETIVSTECQFLVFNVIHFIAVSTIIIDAFKIYPLRLYGITQTD